MALRSAIARCGTAVMLGLVPASSYALTSDASSVGNAAPVLTCVPARLRVLVPVAPPKRNADCVVDIAEAGRTIACTGTRSVGPDDGVSTTYADCSLR